MLACLYPLGSEFKMIPLNTLVQIVSKEVQSFHDFLMYSAGFLVFFVSIGLIKKIMKV